MVPALVAPALVVPALVVPALMVGSAFASAPSTNSRDPVPLRAFYNVQVRAFKNIRRGGLR